MIGDKLYLQVRKKEIACKSIH